MTTIYYQLKTGSPYVLELISYSCIGIDEHLARMMQLAQTLYHGRENAGCRNKRG